jgi:hypothetical protein
MKKQYMYINLSDRNTFNKEEMINFLWGRKNIEIVLTCMNVSMCVGVCGFEVWECMCDEFVVVCECECDCVN